MTPDAIVIEQSALSILDSAIIEEDWFNEFKIPDDNTELKRVTLNNVIYIFTPDADETSGLLVINTKENGVFRSKLNPVQIFERIIRVALRQFDRGISIPVQWSSFNDGALLSIYATNLSRKSSVRICFNRSPDDSNNIYAYDITDTPETLNYTQTHLDAYKKVADGYIDALLTESSPAQLNRPGFRGGLNS